MSVRRAGKIGNDAAHVPADLGLRRQTDAAISARRNYCRDCHDWFPLVGHLQRFLVAVSRIMVDSGERGGVVPLPTIWTAGWLPKRPRRSWNDT